MRFLSHWALIRRRCLWFWSKDKDYARYVRVGYWPLKPSWKGQASENRSELLQIYDGCDGKRLCEIVAGDETWISFFEPEGKENNKVWIGENWARPQIARRSVKRVLYALFFDVRGIVARIPVPEHKTVTGISYAEHVLSVIVKH